MIEPRQVIHIEWIKHKDAFHGTLAQSFDNLSIYISIQGSAGNDLCADAGHPTAAGHAHSARLLAQCAQDAGLLPPGLQGDWGEPLPALTLRLDHDAPRQDEAPLAAADKTPELLAPTEDGHQAFAAGRYDEAWEHYARVLDAAGPASALYANQALVRWHQGRMPEAASLAGLADRARPEDPELRNWLALLTR